MYWKVIFRDLILIFRVLLESKKLSKDEHEMLSKDVCRR